MTTTLNIEAIDEIIDDLQSEPDAFNMGTWFDNNAPWSSCGTTCCIAGDAVLNSIPTDIGRKRVARRMMTEDAVFWIQPRAAKLLGLDVVDDVYSDNGANVPLFFMSDWPEHYLELTGIALGSEWDRAYENRQQAKAAVRLLKDMKAGKVKISDYEKGNPYFHLEWWSKYATNV